jgi:hypothetical protein
MEDRQPPSEALRGTRPSTKSSGNEETCAVSSVIAVADFDEVGRLSRDALGK